MTNYEKLRALADWFDAADKGLCSHTNNNEVQRDLRAMANELEQLQQHNVMESLSPETTGYIIYHNDKVNSMLGAALRCLSTEELCVLRDCLIRRTPPTEGGNAP